MIQSWVQALVASGAAGAQLANSTVATSLLPATAKYIFPAGFFQGGGPQATVVRLTAIGSVSNVVTTPGTLTLDYRLGSVVVFNGAAMQMSTTAHTTLPFWWDVLLTCRASGSSTSANIMGQGKIHGQMFLTSGADVTTHGTLLAPNATPAVGTGFDSTATQQLDMFGTFSVNTSGTNITVQQFIVESLY